MAFDWFRRGTDAEAAETEPAGESTPDTATPETTDAGAEPDYLAFAKAAYANLKAKQAEAAEPDVQVEPEAEAEQVELAESAASAPAEVTPPPTTEAAVPATESAEPDQTEPDPTESDIINEVAPVAEREDVTEPLPDTQEAIAPPTPPEPLTETDDPETPAAPLPAPAAAFFDIAPKAEERLEALEATAVEVPVEPIEPIASPTPPIVPEFPEFDDGFRWSAEILAAQGRRAEDVTVEEISWLQKLRVGLGKTRLRLVNQLKSLVGQGPIDEAAIEEIEAVLLQSDVGVAATDYIVESLQDRVRDRALPPEEAVAYLKDLLREILTVGEPAFAPEQDTLNIWLMVGVNGAGKTTTLGKLAHLANKSGYRTLVAAADTFRAAAVEQVQIWGDRAGVEVIANQGANTDPAAVVFDAISAARARDTELLLVDTAGRLQNKKNLMDELTKIRRIVEKKAPEAKIESLLVLDATLGQNGMRQAEVFAEAADLSGVVLTKLDGTAKGGVALAVAKELELPLRFIGVGEGIEDLRPFSTYEFVEALVSEY